MLFDLLAIAAELLFWHRLLVAMFDTAAWYWSGLWGVFAALDAACLPLGIFLLREGEVSDGDDFIYPAAGQDGTTVRHILKAGLHFSTHAVARLTRTENGILLNGCHARTVDIVHAGDVLTVETGDHRPPRVLPTPGNWPLPVVWEDGHLLVVNKPAGMTAHASNFLPDTPTVAGALAYTRGRDFIFHPSTGWTRVPPALWWWPRAATSTTGCGRAPHGAVLPGVPGRVHGLS